MSAPVPVEVSVLLSSRKKATSGPMVRLSPRDSRVAVMRLGSTMPRLVTVVRGPARVIVEFVMLRAAVENTLLPFSWTRAPVPVLVSVAPLLSFKNSWSEMMVPLVSVRRGPASVRVPPFMVTTFWAAAMIVGSSPRRAEVPVLFSLPPWMSNKPPPAAPVLLVNFASGPARVTLPSCEMRKKDPCVVRERPTMEKSGSVEALVKSPSKLEKLARSCCCAELKICAPLLVSGLIGATTAPAKAGYVCPMRCVGPPSPDTAVASAAACCCCWALTCSLPAPPPPLGPVGCRPRRTSATFVTGSTRGLAKPAPE